MITMVLYKIKAYNAQLVNVFHSVKYSITLKTQLKLSLIIQSQVNRK